MGGWGWKGKEGIFKALEVIAYSISKLKCTHVGENVFWKGQSTKSRDYFARIPARLISTYPILTHTLQNTSSYFWKPRRFSVELTLEPKLSLSFLQGFFSYQQVFRVSKKAWQWSRNKSSLWWIQVMLDVLTWTQLQTSSTLEHFFFLIQEPFWEKNTLFSICSIKGFS